MNDSVVWGAQVLEVDLGRWKAMATRKTILLILAVLLPCGFLILLTRSVLRSSFGERFLKGADTVKKFGSIAGTLLAVSLLLLATCPNAMAKDSSRKKPIRAQKSWKAAVKVDVRGWYDTNTFLLSDGQKTRLQSANPDDQISGRFKDMNSVSDYVFRPSVEEMGAPAAEALSGPKKPFLR